MVLLRTKVGRYFLLAMVCALGLAVAYSDYIPGPAGVKHIPNNHRPPVSAHAGEIVTLKVTWSAKFKPSEIGWAVGTAQQDVPLHMVADVPPQFAQHLPYDPTQRYEIWATGRYPLACEISIDGTPMDNDQVPRGATDERETHCWIEPV